MIYPTVHLNGTSAESLIEGYMEAAHALHEAGRKMAAAYPNGRDYYVQGAGAVDQACNEHEARMNALRGIIKDLEAIAENVSDQQHARSSRRAS